MSTAPGGPPSEEQAKHTIYTVIDLHDAVHAAANKNGWTDRKTRQNAERWYRDYLWLYWNHLQGKVPEVYYLNRDADEVWHYHLVQTQKYQADCEKMFGPGHFLHHTPQTNPKLSTAQRGEARKVYESVGLKAPPHLVNQCMWR
jgi:hypothetical protein